MFPSQSLYGHPHFTTGYCYAFSAWARAKPGFLFDVRENSENFAENQKKIEIFSDFRRNFQNFLENQKIYNILINQRVLENQRHLTKMGIILC